MSLITLKMVWLTVYFHELQRSKNTVESTALPNVLIAMLWPSGLKAG